MGNLEEEIGRQRQSELAEANSDTKGKRRSIRALI